MIWHIFDWIAGSILALAWFSRIVDAARGMRTVADIAHPDWDLKSNFEQQTKPPASSPPKVSIIVPARNEEEDIRQTLLHLLALDYPNYEVIAVNDRSTDRTGQIMDDLSCGADTPVRVSAAPELPAETATSVGATNSKRLQILHIAALAPGWLGKTHAMWAAAQQSSGDWLLFTDADVIFRRDALRRAIAYAEAERADHLVLFPQMIMKGIGEKMMLAFFQVLFVFGHRPWKVADPKARDHMGVGAFNLVRRSVYDAIGTYRALRMDLIDDMKLGKLIKNAGFAQRNVFGQDLISLHWGHGAFGIVDNLTKNFFAVLYFQWWRTLITVIGLAFLNLGPFLGIWLARGWARLPYAIALASLFALYYGMRRRSRIPPYCFFLHPVAATLFLYILLRSMGHALWNGGIVWRGTKYPLAELRDGMV